MCGKVDGAVVASELHLDGTTSERVFAPGFGEFFTQNDAEIEVLALAVPANREHAAERVELAKLETGASTASTGDLATAADQAARLANGIRLLSAS